VSIYMCVLSERERERKKERDGENECVYKYDRVRQSIYSQSTHKYSNEERHCNNTLQQDKCSCVSKMIRTKHTQILV